MVFTWWHCLGGANLLKEVHHCGWGLRVHSPAHSQFILLLYTCHWRYDLSAFCSGFLVPCLPIIDSPPGILSPNNYFSKSCLGHDLWSHQENVSEVAAQTEDEIYHLSLYHMNSRTQTIGCSRPPHVRYLRTDFATFRPWRSQCLEYCRQIVTTQWQLIKSNKHKILRDEVKGSFCLFCFVSESSSTAKGCSNFWCQS